MQFKLLTMIAALAFLVACGGGGDEAKKGGSAPAGADKAAKKAKKSKLAGWDTLSSDRLVELGKVIYETQGGNTCNDCHGMEGHSGRLKEAADLRKPSTWKAFKKTGGDAAKMETRLLALIESGAGIWNETHKDDTYDINMMGVTQSATKSSLKKLRKQLKKKDKIGISKDELTKFGAKAVYSYVLSLKNEDSAPAAAPAAPAPTGETKPTVKPAETPKAP